VDCSFVGNTADSGGALYLSSSCSVTNCTFDGNKAITGGALVTDQWSKTAGGTTPFVDCTFIDNVATPGGGATAQGGALFASRNAFASFAGCHFVASAVTTKGNNDIARTSTTAPRGLVEFICPVNSTGASVMMKPDDLLVTQLPPQQQIVHCTP
jgi:predicted outer membrane repeat protein